MAAAELAIAKAALSATLFRADPKSLSRPSVEAFFPLLDAATTQCSRPNVQKCRAWIVEYVAPSSARTAALGKYLVAMSKNLNSTNGPKPSARRRRLHILYILSDALHHTVRRKEDKKFEKSLQASLPHLVAHTAAFKNCPKHALKLDKLVALWAEKGYVSPGLVPKLRQALTGDAPEPEAQQQQQTAAGSTSLKIAKETPFVLPSQHGDTSTPWFDLPASTWLPQLTPNSTKPMLPDLIQPIQLNPGPADKVLTDAVQALLSDVDRIFSQGRNWENSNDSSHHTDTNQLGEMVLIDEVTGDIVGGETYYGWSREFCEKMKERQRKAKSGHGRGQQSRSRSISDVSESRSPSASPAGFKRRRRSSSLSSHGDRHRKFNRASSRGYSRSPDRRGAFDRRSSSRPRSPSRPRYGDDRRRSPDRRHTTSDQVPPLHAQASHYPPVPPPPYQNLAPGAFPPPPPPPPPAGYQGPWPPPPPPQPPAGVPISNWFPGPGFIPAPWDPNGPPPPPLPPGPSQPQQGGWVPSHRQDGGGSWGSGYGGRGNFGRGRRN